MSKDNVIFCQIKKDEAGAFRFKSPGGEVMNIQSLGKPLATNDGYIFVGYCEEEKKADILSGFDTWHSSAYMDPICHGRVHKYVMFLRADLLEVDG